MNIAYYSFAFVILGFVSIAGSVLVIVSHSKSENILSRKNELGINDINGVEVPLQRIQFPGTLSNVAVLGRASQCMAWISLAVCAIFVILDLLGLVVYRRLRFCTALESRQLPFLSNINGNAKHANGKHLKPKCEDAYQRDTITTGQSQQQLRQTVKVLQAEECYPSCACDNQRGLRWWQRWVVVEELAFWVQDNIPYIRLFFAICFAIAWVPISIQMMLIGITGKCRLPAIMELGGSGGETEAVISACSSIRKGAIGSLVCWISWVSEAATMLFLSSQGLNRYDAYRHISEKYELIRQQQRQYQRQILEYPGTIHPPDTFSGPSIPAAAAVGTIGTAATTTISLGNQYQIPRGFDNSNSYSRFQHVQNADTHKYFVPHPYDAAPAKGYLSGGGGGSSSRFVKSGVKPSNNQKRHVSMSQLDDERSFVSKPAKTEMYEILYGSSGQKQYMQSRHHSRSSLGGNSGSTSNSNPINVLPHYHIRHNLLHQQGQQFRESVRSIATAELQGARNVGKHRRKNLSEASGAIHFANNQRLLDRIQGAGAFAEQPARPTTLALLAEDESYKQHQQQHLHLHQQNAAGESRMSKMRKSFAAFTKSKADLLAVGDNKKRYTIG